MPHPLRRAHSSCSFVLAALAATTAGAAPLPTYTAAEGALVVEGADTVAVEGRVAPRDLPRGAAVAVLVDGVPLGAPTPLAPDGGFQVAGVPLDAALDGRVQLVVTDAAGERTDDAAIDLLDHAGEQLVPGGLVHLETVAPAPTVIAHDAALAKWGDTRFDEMTWLATHNAFNNYEDSHWLVANQGHGIRTQLDRGVRGLMLDTHWFAGSSDRVCTLSLGTDCYPAGVYLCHGDCDSVPGVNYALPRMKLEDTMNGIAAFLDAHPTEVVTVWFEDYTERAQLMASLGNAHTRSLLFKPAQWTSRGLNAAQGRWPKLADMVAANQRLIVLTDRGGNVDESQGVLFVQTYTVENYWSLGTIDLDYSCKTRWDGKPLSSPGLFTMNHFRDVPTPINAELDNTTAQLTSRVNDQCTPAAGRDPSFVVVDFYQIPDDAPRRFVDGLNAARGVPRGDGASGGGDPITTPDLGGAAGCACHVDDHGSRGATAAPLLLAGLLLVRRRRR